METKLYKCVCVSCEVVEKEQTAYCRCVFNQQNDNNTNLFFAASQRKINMILSGGYFDGNKPNKSVNLAWAKAFAEKAVKQTANILAITVPVQPFKRINSDGVVNETINNTVTVNVFAGADGKTNLTEQQITNQANRLLESMIANDRAVLVDNKKDETEESPFNNTNVSTDMVF